MACDRCKKKDCNGCTSQCARCRRLSCICRGKLKSFCKTRRYEISTRGPDASFEGIGSDPYRGHHNLGLPIPDPTGVLFPVEERLLFLLAIAEFPKACRARLVGIRQLLELEGDVPTAAGCTYVTRLSAESPLWHPPDGNVSWHLRKLDIGRPNSPRSNAANADAVSYLMAQGPSLLFRTPFPAYSAPNGGRPYGEPLHPDLGTFYDMRFPWQGDHFDAMRIPIRGRCAVAMFASVLVTDPTLNRCSLVGTTVPLTSPPLTPEDVFLNTVPNARFGRIAASMIFEDDAT